jgi:4-hydroxy-3-polyprenylbenzoate decarboxylase
MHGRCLSDFLEELGEAGELVRVEAEVDPRLEIAEITARVCRAGGSALLFPAVRGHEIPVLTNLLGSEARLCRALGVAALGELCGRVARLIAPAEGAGWLDRLRGVGPAAALANVLPRQVRAAACQQIVRLGSDVDLGVLPLVQAAPQDAGRAVAAAPVYTAEPDSHRQLSACYDLVPLGRDRLAVGWAAGDEPARLLVEYRRRQGRMPLAVALGGEPAAVLAAAAGWSPQLDTFALAGLLGQRPLDVVACRSVELAVPAETEIVLEGYVDPGEPPVPSGPRVTPLGLYGPPQPAPAMHVTAVTQRANPVYWAMLPGPPPNEMGIIHRAMAGVLLPLVQLGIAELVDYDLPLLGGGRHWAVLAIRKGYAGQARRVAAIARGLPPLGFAKFLVVVDAEVDVHDSRQVLGAMAAHVDPGRDVVVEEGPPDPCDAATPAGALGCRLVIDATAKLPGERAAPAEPARMSESIIRLVTDRWPQYGLPSPPAPLPTNLRSVPGEGRTRPPLPPGEG